MTKGWLIVFSGLPGVGKTTLARELARVLGAVYLRIDAAEDGIRRSALKPEDAMDAGYRAIWELARENLELGATVIGDGVNPVVATRSGWRHIAHVAKARMTEIEVICSDEELHRIRVEERRRWMGTSYPNWNDVITRRYEARTDARIIIDTARMSAEDGIANILIRTG